MSNELPTIDPVQAFSAAQDSVALVAQLLALPSRTEAEDQRLWANAKHLEIMLGKNIFNEAQTSTLQASVDTTRGVVDLKVVPTLVSAVASKSEKS